MSSTAPRPPYIVAFAGDFQGCNFHRIMLPLASMVEPGAADGRIDIQIWPDEVGQAANPDVVIWQRQVEDAQIETMRRWRAFLPNALFVYELDDYLGEIPPASFHAGFMPPDIAKRVARGVAVCDRVTTTTEPMAEWLRSLGARDVRVVPNGLPVGRLKERETPTGTGKVRIGFAGGMSHSGDLEILRNAMTTIGETNATWVFFGTQPENPACRIEFHEGVPVSAYLDKMATLNIDLMVAPLEDNQFNRCKSNLRLIEAGAMGCAVIAQDLPTYHTNAPPVFGFAGTPSDWTTLIRAFIDARPSARKNSADAMRSWVGRHYTLERLLPLRCKAWLPDELVWKPSPAALRRHEPLPVVSCLNTADLAERMPFLARCNRNDKGLESACATALSLDTDVLWLRPATSLDAASFKTLQSTIASATDIASVTPIACDGANAFPQTDRWQMIPPAASTVIADTLRMLFPARQFTTPTPSGPVVALSRHALRMLGAPDVAGCDGSEEQAIFEWGLRASARRWKHIQAADAFGSSLAPPAQPTPKSALRLQARGWASHLQTPSTTFTPEEREAVELRLLRAQWGGPRPGSMGFSNDYEAWSALREAQNAIANPLPQVPSISIFTRDFGEDTENYTDGWTVFLDETVTLYHGAFAQLTALAQSVSDNVKVIYADHDTLLGEKTIPEFKPDFDKELFLAQDYVTPICAVRNSIVQTAPQDRSDLYRHILRIALWDGSPAFLHTPSVLGSMKVDATPEQQALEALQRQVIIQTELGEAVNVIASRHVVGCLNVTHNWRHPSTPDDAPLVSIVIPTLGSGRLIQPCVATILQHTQYPNYEVIVVQNGPQAQPELNQSVLDDPRVRVVRDDVTPFNWSGINNRAIHDHAVGDFIVTMNDDVCVSTKNWLDDMMGRLLQPDVGVVGAKLVHPMGFIQHIGVVCHKGVAGHMHKGVGNGQPGHLGRAMLTHEASAVTGACMAFSRATFNVVGGFDESLAYNYNDTVFCLAVRGLGKRVVVEMAAELLHPEGTTRESPFTPAGLQRLISDGNALAAKCPGDDPYWSRNLAIGVSNGGLNIAGLNAEMLAWSDFIPQPHSARVLLVNDLPGPQGYSLNILKSGGIPFAADLSGFHMKLTAPDTLNIRVWDVRDPGRMSAGLKTLGIDRIELRSLVGASGAAPPVETLHCFKALGIPVMLNPVDISTMAPWLSEDSPASSASVFGHVDMAAWRQVFDTFETNIQDAVVREAAE